MGEKLSDLEQFYPDRMASRILGMGDVLTLIEKAEAQIDADKAKEMEAKIKKAEFDFDDFLEYMGQIRNMGGIGSIMSMLPGMGLGGNMKNIQMPDEDEAEANLKRTEAIIHSMTAKERKNPDILNPSRKNRIARGAGVNISEVNRLVKQFEQMKKMMKQMPGMMKGAKKGRFKLPF
jgi:signal recognition particle subunit SRP54